MAELEKLDSIYDLARKTGVSYSTVSRVLNGRGRISEATRKKVLAVAQSCNFKPKMQARCPTISLMLSHYDNDMLMDEYFLPLLGACINSLSRHDIAINFHSRYSSSAMRNAMLDGILAVPWDRMSKELLLNLDTKIPCVLVNEYFADSISSVMADHYQGGRLAAEHLLSKGHRKASILVETIGSFGNTERVRGFVETYKQAGLEVPDSLIFDHPKRSIMDALAVSLEQGASAIFFGAHKTGDLILTAHRMKIAIPDDLSVIVMEGINSARCQIPPLTAIEQELDAVADKAVELLLAQIAEPPTCPVHLWLNVNRLVERESVKKH